VNIAAVKHSISPAPMASTFQSSDWTRGDILRHSDALFTYRHPFASEIN